MHSKISFLFFLFISILPIKAEECWSENVKKKSDGEVFIKNIPQVDQRNSYCVPGSVEMILRYFDSKLNQDRLGKLFDSDRRGTGLEAMLKGFSQRKLFKEFSVEKIYYLYDDSAEYRNFIEAYVDEKIANSKRKTQQRDREIQKLLKLADVSDKMDPKYSAFGKRRVALDALLSATIKQNIDSGIPILWIVFLRFDPHDRRADSHARVITGYVEKNGKIESVIYSDSWGKISVNQKVSYDNALAMTQGLYRILPRAETDKALTNPSGKENPQNMRPISALLPHDVVLELVPVPAGKSIKPFYIGKYEVTQQQYRTLMGKNLSKNKGEDYPVEKVSWEEAIEFCKRLTKLERKNKRITEQQAYTLPTTEQWRYACTTNEELINYANTDLLLLNPHLPAKNAKEKEIREIFPAPLSTYAWFRENANWTTHPVGKKKPNNWGIFDMYGNVSEWIRNSYQAIGINYRTYYVSDTTLVDYYNASRRFRTEYRSSEIGFRVVLITIGQE